MKKILMLCLAGVIFAGATLWAGSAISDAFSVKFDDQKEDFQRFEYTLKNSYSNREDVMQEINRLGVYYKNHIENCSDEYVNSIKPQFTELQKRLSEELKKFPDSTSEPSTEQKFTEEFEFWKSQYIQWKGYKNDPDSDFRSGYLKIKAIYDQCLDIKARLESGEITLEQAYNEIDALHFS